MDLISSMPHEILHHILSFLPTQFAIRTSALSKSWRHVWCHTPHLDFGNLNSYGEEKARDIHQTLSLYRSTKIISFHLDFLRYIPVPQINSWIEFVVSRNVEKMFLGIDGILTRHVLENIFYLSSSLTQLCIENLSTAAGCRVSWKSLRKLSFYNSNLYGEFIDNFLSGSPLLESLELDRCRGPQRLDLSKSLSLRRFEINHRGGLKELIDIVAPHIHYLNLRNSCEAPCTLVDVSSLLEARLDISVDSFLPLNLDFLQTMLLKMLAKLQNVKTLTFTGPLLQILSLAEFHGIRFPTFMVETLTVETSFTRSVIPGLARLLQNSPQLKRLIAQATLFVGIHDTEVDNTLKSQGLNPEQYWRSKYEVFPSSDEFGSMIGCKDEMWKLMASFIDVVMRNVKTLEALVVGLKHIEVNVSDARWFEELLPTLPNNNNVSILLKH